LDDVRSVGHILAELGIAQDVQRSHGKCGCESGVQYGMGGGRVAHATASSPSVLARISARWMVLMLAY
jgi:hypothetical protein